MKIYKILFFVLLAIFSSKTGFSFTEVAGFSNPYGIAVDEKDGFIYVSNVNGAMDAKDNNGFISRLKSDGSIDELNFISGGTKEFQLNAPKGMVVLGNYLYVCDIEKLHVFNHLTKKFLFDINFGDLPIQNLNSLTVGPDDAIYMTDSGSARVYRNDVNKQHEVTSFIENPDLGGVTGIVWYPVNQSFVLSAGLSGRIVAFDGNGVVKQMPSIFLKSPQGLGIDDNGSIYVADMSFNAVYRIASNFALFGYRQAIKTPTGIAYNRISKRIIISSFDDNKVSLFSIDE